MSLLLGALFTLAAGGFLWWVSFQRRRRMAAVLEALWVERMEQLAVRSGLRFDRGDGSLKGEVGGRSLVFLYLPERQGHPEGADIGFRVEGVSGRISMVPRGESGTFQERYHVDGEPPAWLDDAVRTTLDETTLSVVIEASRLEVRILEELDDEVFQIALDLVRYIVAGGRSPGELWRLRS